MKKIEVASLTVNVGSTSIQMTIEEAEALHRALSKMFKEKVVVKDQHSPWYWHYPAVTYGNDSVSYTLKDNAINCSVKI
jgi:hypothetical protein